MDFKKLLDVVQSYRMMNADVLTESEDKELLDQERILINACHKIDHEYYKNDMLPLRDHLWDVHNEYEAYGDNLPENTGYYVVTVKNKTFVVPVMHVSNWMSIQAIDEIIDICRPEESE